MSWTGFMPMIEAVKFMAGRVISAVEHDENGLYRVHEVENRVTGSPYDRGDADAYYGRPARPHKRIGLHEKDYNLTPEEIREYRKGMEDNPSGQKDWG